MIAKYKVEYFRRYGTESVTERDSNALEELLNKRVKEGWELDSLTNTSIGFLLVFRSLLQPHWVGNKP